MRLTWAPVPKRVENKQPILLCYRENYWASWTDCWNGAGDLWKCKEGLGLTEKIKSGDCRCGKDDTANLQRFYRWYLRDERFCDQWRRLGTDWENCTTWRYCLYRSRLQRWAYPSNNTRRLCQLLNMLSPSRVAQSLRTRVNHLAEHASFEDLQQALSGFTDILMMRIILDITAPEWLGLLMEVTAVSVESIWVSWPVSATQWCAAKRLNGLGDLGGSGRSYA